MIEATHNSMGLPKGWIDTELGQIAEILSGIGFPKKYQGKREGEFPFYKVGDISQAVLKGSVCLRGANNYVSKDVCRELKGKPLKAGSVVFAKIGEAIRLNRRAILTGEALVDNNVMGVCAFLPDISSFLYYFLLTVTLGDLSRATTIPSVRKGDVEKISFPLPPLADQKRIVAKIEELFTKLDAGVEALKKVKAELKRYRQAVLKAAFEGKLTADWREKNKDKLEPASKLLERIAKEREKAIKGKQKKLPPLDTSELPELPTGWEWTRICEVSADNQIGLVKSHVQQNKEGRGVGYIKMNNVTMDGKVVFDDLVYVEADASEIARFALREKDILFNTRNSVELVGKTGLVRNIKGPLIYNNNLMRIRTMGGIVPSFMACQMCSTDFRGRMEKVKRATTNVAALYAKDVLPLPLILSSEREQQQIVAEIERHFSIADEVEQTIEKSLKESERLRQSILKKAFEGKLVEQNPEDEPAEKLLERIKAEKKKTTDNSKKKLKVR